MRTWRLASQHSHAIPCVCIGRHSIQRALAGRGSDNTLTFNNTMKKNCVSHSCTSHKLLGNTQTPRSVAVTSLTASCLDATASVSISFTDVPLENTHYSRYTTLTLPCSSGHQQLLHRVSESASIFLPAASRWRCSSAQELYMLAARVCRVCIRSNSCTATLMPREKNMDIYKYLLIGFFSPHYNIQIMLQNATIKFHYWAEC